MYFISMSVKSDCGLSRAAVFSAQKIITLNVVNRMQVNNIIAFTISHNLEEVKTGIAKDFKKYSITKGKSSLFLFGIKESHGIIPSIVDSFSIPLFPFYAENGTETFQLLSPDKDSIDKILSLIGKDNIVESVNYERITDGDSVFTIFKKINMMTYTSNLTDIEMKIIKKALNEGFFSWPRSFDLSAMSNSFSLAKPTVLYHLRNAERKIMYSMFGY